LIQIIGRASRNPDSEVVLYADQFTESMVKALRETYRRREIQDKFNKEH
jgi:excinuclease ABC subunit B